VRLSLKEFFMPLRHTLLSACAAAFPVFASTYTASVVNTPFPPDSGVPQTCSQTGNNPVSCSESLTIDQGAFATGEASSGITTSLSFLPGIPFIAATVSGIANPLSNQQEFVNLVASASFDVSITILGQPTGTPGYIGFLPDDAPPADGGATLNIPADLLTSTPGCPFKQGPCAPFLFGVPFEVQGKVNFGINEAVDSGAAAIGDFTIFDQNFHLLESAALPDPNGVIDVVPEPSTILLLGSALALLLGLRAARICRAESSK
jgi:hypothetical protein